MTNTLYDPNSHSFYYTRNHTLFTLCHGSTNKNDTAPRLKKLTNQQTDGQSDMMRDKHRALWEPKGEEPNFWSYHTF